MDFLRRFRIHLIVALCSIGFTGTGMANDHHSIQILKETPIYLITICDSTASARAQRELANAILKSNPDSGVDIFASGCFAEFATLSPAEITEADVMPIVIKKVGEIRYFYCRITLKGGKFEGRYGNLVVQLSPDRMNELKKGGYISSR